ncbi:hypothetical protein [Dactylosporangium matsuzakiense]|uniref:Dolichyl-phosphate-mannose-protein mannosyltransferase n=1 Tax=Dactylosporangium matsuzakiense TaxID=53360 RepID=A0A9W6NJ96_9ACTN|nr:hypothetical protein [Dactylosporangium matsuzakiense]UWZ45211.1 hypothetical protein Dmats_01220 [Dactylosporangium matsuzakiense]GLK98827.1 hypothetical protein GCM10017581_005680 [Dactylosporangium matsuzakiense]
MIPNARALLALLPVATLVFAAVALRPRAEADRTLAVVRASVAVAAGAVVGAEVLSLFNWVSPVPFALFWLLSALGTGCLAWRSRPGLSASRLREGLAGGWPSLDRADRAVAVAAVIVGLLVVSELVLAVASAPNNFDSNSYHLAKIEHWVANGNLDNFATVQTQQIILVPGAELLLLHLRLLTGGDGPFNLLQWAAGLLGALAVARCACQLGAGRLGQWLAAAVFLTAPAIVLESTSTQNDLVVTAWVACAATVALDARDRPTRWAGPLTLAGASGLVMVTKSTGVMALLPVLAYWAVQQIRTKRLLPLVYGTSAVILACIALAGPSLLRVQEAFGSPFGPPEYREALSTTRHDPPAILVNGLRLGASTLLSPVEAINEAISGTVVGVADAVGVNPNDPGITQWRSIFPGDRWKPDEDRSPYPVQSALVLLATALGLAWRRTRGYALLVLGALLTTAAIVKWQYWGNRLILPAFGLATPLAGYMLERAVRVDRAWLRRSLAALVALVMLAGAAHGYVAVYYGQPRRLVGPGSVFELDAWQQRFARMPDQAAGYRTAIEQVRAAGAERVGLVMDGDLWEYPLQIELRDRQLIELQSNVPGHPPGDVASVDAVVCVGGQEPCRRIVPTGWQYNRIDQFVTTAFPPR